MSKLSQQTCSACRADAPLATQTEIDDLMLRLPEWQIIEVEGVQQLQRLYLFSDFSGALDFSNKVGEIAESEGHHPAILLEWGKVTVTWWSHKLKGLHTNDFIMAAKTDDVFS